MGYTILTKKFNCMNKYEYATLLLVEVLHEMERADEEGISIDEYKNAMTEKESDSMEDLERILDKFGVVLDRLRDNSYNLR